MQGNDIANYCVQERLRDERTVTIRAIRPDDKGRITDVIREMSSESLYRRMFSVKRDLSDHELRQLTEVDFDKIVALVAIMKEAEQDRIVGGGRYVRCGEPPAAQKAEIAFLIDDAYQGRGIGSLIFRHLVSIASAAGVKTLEAEVLPSNDGMLRLFDRSGLRVIKTRTRDSVHVTIDLTSTGKGGQMPAGSELPNTSGEQP
jgi:RimJ/RimL family protein N-acetyltransferase